MSATPANQVLLAVGVSTAWSSIQVVCLAVRFFTALMVGAQNVLAQRAGVAAAGVPIGLGNPSLDS
jgi:hypothetical protein